MKIRLDSAYAVQTGPNRWELREAVLDIGCFHMGYKPGSPKAAGSFDACYAAARLLGFHVDGIQPL